MTTAPGRPPVGNTPAPSDLRPLGRSLAPIAGESLDGYLLRLSCRLRISPVRLARLTGCVSRPGPVIIRRRLLLDIDVQRFAQATRLSVSEASSLAVASWADRYPPLARSRAGSPQTIDGWAFSIGHRYCPDCLAGDGSPLQQQYGGPWKKDWHLPATFTCPRHQRFLREGCPQPHPGSQAIWRPPGWLLIAFPSAAGLHPAQCRRPLGTGRPRAACGTRLDEPGEERLPRPSPAILDTQQALLALLSPEHPAQDAARTFTDLRVISALLCRSWPLGQDLMDSRLAAAVSEHTRQLNTRFHLALDRQPDSLLATAGLLTAAAAIRDSSDLQDTLAHHLQPRSLGIPALAWTRVLGRHQPGCSPRLREAALPLAARLRRADSH
jgi:hypothetical protein